MPLPQELQSGPPRNLENASQMLDKNKKGIRSTLIGLILMPAVLLFVGMVVPHLTGYQLRGLTPESAPWISLFVDIFIALFLLVFILQLQRSKKLFREGQATLGKVTAVSAPGAGGKQATFIMITVEYLDLSGRTLTGQASTTGNTLQCQVGDEVPVLYFGNQSVKFAIYYSELGMIPGIAKIKN